MKSKIEIPVFEKPKEKKVENINFVNKNKDEMKNLLSKFENEKQSEVRKSFKKKETRRINGSVDDLKVKEPPGPKKPSKAYDRFKRAKRKEKERENAKNNPTKNIEEMKPAAAQNVEEKEIIGQKTYRGASVECGSNVEESNMVKIYENVHVVQNKKGKKSKINKFAL